MLHVYQMVSVNTGKVTLQIHGKIHTFFDMSSSQYSDSSHLARRVDYQGALSAPMRNQAGVDRSATGSSTSTNYYCLSNMKLNYLVKSKAGRIAVCIFCN